MMMDLFKESKGKPPIIDQQIVLRNRETKGAHGVRPLVQFMVVIRHSTNLREPLLLDVFETSRTGNRETD
jgi:hypothetical protein